MKRIINIKKSNKKFNSILYYSLLVIILFISVGYSSMNTALNISGKGYFRVSDWIRITSMNLSNTSSGGVENYSSKYSKNELISSISLPNGNSSVTYSFTIENFSEKYGYIKSITNTQYSNNNVEYEITGCNIDDTIDPHQVLNCTITFTNVSGSNDLSSIIEFEFDELISSDANLIDLSVLNYQLSPPFVEDIDEYSVSVEESEITIIATTSSDKATVSGDGVVPVTWGNSIKEVIVTAEDSTRKTYYINVNNIRPTAPVIEIDSDEYVGDKHTVSITTAGTALSDVDYYEYYISDTNGTPNEDVTVSGTTNNNTEITSNGSKYVFYRTVSKHGNRSLWSNGVESKIDKQDPYASITATDTYPNDVPTITFNPTTVDNESGMDYYEIYYKLSTDNNYQLLNGTTVTGIAGATYNYYLIAYDKVGNHTTTDVDDITLKTYGQNETCGYTYSDYTSTKTNDVSSCTDVAQTDDGLTYTTCELGNWSTTPSSSKVDSCTEVAQTSTGTSYTTCTLDSSWTSNGTSNVNSCTASETTTSKVTCTTNSWSSSSSQTNSCSASGNSSSNTQYVTCSENSFTKSKDEFTTSCTASEGNTTKITCETGYYKIQCGCCVTAYNKTGKCDCGSTCTKTSGYKRKITYTRSYKYTKKTYTRASKYKQINYYKKYTKNIYARLYNKTVYTRTKIEKTCWH